MSFKTDYRQTFQPNLRKKIGDRNVHALPKLEKITINAGIGTYLKGEKDASSVIDGITRITSQRPVVKKARMSISNFKLREGMPVGVMVTLRGDRMYDFLERLIKIVFPRIRDFRGFSAKSFDGKGNYSLGIKDHLIFPEIPTDQVIKPFGLQITITTTAKNDQEAKMLLDEFGFPFRTV